MSADLLIRRIIRRETNRSRALVSIITAAALLVLLLWLCTETVLALTGNAALLASPAQTGHWLTGLPRTTLPGGLIAAGLGLVLLGLLYLALAVRPGRRSRHALASDRAAVVVDDDVIAAAISRTVRTAAGLAPEQVTTSIGTRNVDVLIHPSSGTTVGAAAAEAAARAEIGRYGLAAPPRVSIRTSTKGALGI